jgi:repressor LexA
VNQGRPKPALTKRQRQILDYYQDYVVQHGISPTLEEVAQHFEVNKVTIFGHVAELERKGLLSRAGKRVSRGLQLTDLAEQHGNGRGGTTTIPILGKIAAGRPIEAIEDREELELTDLIPPGAEVYALRVRGESMIDDGIRDGDVVLVERRTSARDGEMVVAILPGEEATLKRLYRHPAGFRLQPANAAMQPILTPTLEVRGVVLGVIRRF